MKECKRKIRKEYKNVTFSALSSNTRNLFYNNHRADANRVNRVEQSIPRILTSINFHALNFNGILACQRFPHVEKNFSAGPDKPHTNLILYPNLITLIHTTQYANDEYHTLSILIKMVLI